MFSKRYWRHKEVAVALSAGWQTRGNAMIEFTLFFPLLLSVILYLLEAGFLFNATQDITMVSRESAQLVYRHCLQEGNANPINSCVENTLKANIAGFASRVIDRFDDQNGTIIISLYRWNVAQNNWQREELAVIWNNTVPGKTQPLTRLPATFPQETIDPGKSLFVVAEVILNYQALAVVEGLNYALPSELYDATVM